MKKWIGIALALCVSTSVFATEEIAYLAGELPPPAKIEKVLSAGNPADVLLLSSAPNKLLGLAGSTTISTNLGKNCRKRQYALARENCGITTEFNY